MKFHSCGSYQLVVFGNENFHLGKSTRYQVRRNNKFTQLLLFLIKLCAHHSGRFSILGQKYLKYIKKTKKTMKKGKIQVMQQR